MHVLRSVIFLVGTTVCASVRVETTRLNWSANEQTTTGNRRFWCCA